MKLWKVLSLKVNSYEISKVLSSSVSRMLTLAWGIDILFEKLTPEIGGGGGGGGIWKNFLHCTMTLGVGISCKACHDFKYL